MQPAPRPFQCLIFDHLQYTQIEEEGLVHFILSDTCVNVYLGRQKRGGVPNRKNQFYLQCLSKCWSLNICKAENLPLIIQDEKRAQNLICPPAPLPVYLGRHLRDRMDQAFLLHSCILEAIKNWMVGRPLEQGQYTCTYMYVPFNYTAHCREHTTAEYWYISSSKVGQISVMVPGTITIKLYILKLQDGHQVLANDLNTLILSSGS